MEGGHVTIAILNVPAVQLYNSTTALGTVSQESANLCFKTPSSPTQTFFLTVSLKYWQDFTDKSKAKGMVEEMSKKLENTLLLKDG